MSSDLNATFVINPVNRAVANFSLGATQPLSAGFSLGSGELCAKVEGKGSISVELVDGKYVVSQTTYVHEQAVASSEWVINHNLGREPSVLVIDTAGSVIICDVVYNSLNQLTLLMNNNVKGKAYLN